ncbi:MAG: DUF4387 domain-containing protein [Lachnospiraceae bacterium]|nr:DUF4387 domain-containing protein [Lachnospiraceae bacterium]
MKRLVDVAAIIRSKNSGPFELTMDVIFTDKDNYEKFLKGKYMNSHKISELYKIPLKDVVDIVEFPGALAVKATIIRPLPSGALGERDVYGAQQHVPLMMMELSGWD